MWRIAPCLCVLACNAAPSAGDAGDAGEVDAAPIEAAAFESGASLTGAQAFGVAYAWMDPASPAKECTANQIGGAYAATAIDLFEYDVSQTVCTGNLGGSGRVVSIGIATNQYAGKHAITVPLTPGTYVIGDENVPDEDLCQLPTNTTAILQVLGPGDAGAYDALWNGASGQVIVTSVTASNIVGTFTVVLGDPNGGAADGGALSGSFSAEACP